VAGAWLWNVSVGCVAGLALSDGREVVVKAYTPDRDVERLVTVGAVQTFAADAGLPAPRPLSDPAPMGLGWAMAETALFAGRRPDLLTDRDRRTAAAGWVRLSDVLDDFAAQLSASAPMAGRAASRLYPVPHSPIFNFDATSTGAEWIDALASVAWRAMREVERRERVVHMDWRADNIRVSDDGSALVAIYDWDSLRVEREVEALGQVAAMHTVSFSVPSGPHYPTGDECLAFTSAVELARTHSYSLAEWLAIRAAIVYGWCYTARCEHALAAIGQDQAHFKMRDRLRAEGASLLSDTTRAPD
jgi:hypothetical protein